MTHEERVRDCLRAIEARDPALGAFVEVTAASALAGAREADARRREGKPPGALDGMPLAVKDNIDVAGARAAAGLRTLKDRRPPRDAACVARLREQGAVFLGKTLMDEAAFGALGDNPAFGRCHNPLRRGCTAGGSSSGSAAAVAAGLCVAALGTDTLGSVRIPASYCGVVGYVPSRGLIDMAGVMPLSPSFDRVGVLARSVSDAAAVAAAMAPSIGVRKTRNAVIGMLQGFEGFDPIIHALKKRGHRVVPVDCAGFDWTAARRAALLVIEIEGARALAAFLDDPASGISARLREALDFGRRASAERVARAQVQLEAARAQVRTWLRRCDIVLLPSTPQAAFRFDETVPSNQADLAAPSSILGLPSISVPAQTAADGLPLGAQLMAAEGADALLLGVAACLA